MIHLEVVKHILQGNAYEYNTCFQEGDVSILRGYTNSNWVEDCDEQKCIYGYLFQLGECPIMECFIII